MRRRLFLVSGAVGSLAGYRQDLLAAAEEAGPPINSSVPQRDVARYGLPHYQHGSLEEFSIDSGSSGAVHTVTLGDRRDLPIDMLVDVTPGTPLVVWFNGAQDRTRSKLPVFVRPGAFTPSSASLLSINDPCLYLTPDLSLAWYAGATRLPLQRIIPKLLKRVTDYARPSKLVFAGGSGGGFAAMFYASLFQRSLAFVWNPQTDILSYNSRHVAAYAKAAFDFATLPTARRLLPNHVESAIAPLYRGAENNYVVYLQNSTDWQIQTQFKPFLADIGASAESIQQGLVKPWLYTFIGTWGNGHVSPPRKSTKAIITGLLQSRNDWPTALRHEVGPLLTAHLG